MSIQNPIPFEAAIVVYKEEGILDTRLALLTDWFGVQNRAICLGRSEDPGEFLSPGSVPACVMVSASSLAAIWRDPSIPAHVVSELFRRPPFVLVYGITGSDEEAPTSETACQRSHV